jgi:hypothetical protein
MLSWVHPDCRGFAAGALLWWGGLDIMNIQATRCVMAEIIEGIWEDLAGRQDLQGRKVRVVVLDEPVQAEAGPWLKSLQAWADSHEPVEHWVDDSRESIYTGTVDDPR